MSTDIESLDQPDDYTVFDVELNDENKGKSERPSTSEPRYVYDLYYTNSDDFGDAEIDEFVRYLLIFVNLYVMRLNIYHFTVYIL